MPDRFTPKVKDILTSSGWFEGRNVDISGVRKLIELQSFVINDAAERVLREFGGLRVKWRYNDVDREPLHFADPHAEYTCWGFVTGGRQAEAIEYLSGIAGGPLCPVAFSVGGWTHVLPSGRTVHVDQDWEYIGYEPSIERFIEVMCEPFGKFGTRIELPEDDVSRIAGD